MNIMINNDFVVTLKPKLKAILIQLKMISRYETILAEESKKNRNVVVVLYKKSKLLSSQIKLRSKTIDALLKEADLKLDFTTINRLIITWMNGPDRINNHLQHINFLYISLILSELWVDQTCSISEIKNDLMGELKELCFSLTVYLEEINVKMQLLMFTQLIPLEIIESKIQQILDDPSLPNLISVPLIKTDGKLKAKNKQ